MKGPSEVVLRRLAGELDRARRGFLDLQRKSMKILRDAPSGIPLSDGQFRIIQSGKQVAAAFAQYEEALREYRNFLERGILPEDPDQK